MFAFADPTELWLEIPPAAQSSQSPLWQPTAYSQPWTAYLNQLCLDALLAWIRTEQAENAADATDPAVWEFVSGAAINLADKRLILVPSEAIDQAELAVPQEWVDLPDWAGDYYLAVQVALEPEAWIRVWGYASHQELKAGRYDPDDRSYCLDSNQLTQDWSALWVTIQFCPEAQTRAVLAPLPNLPTTQAESLIQRLSGAANPRLAIPFELWGALIQQPQWRQQLYQQRVAGALEEVGARQILSQWLAGLNQLSQQARAGWQQLEELLSPAELGWSLRGAAAAGVRQAKLLELADRQIALVLQVSRDPDERLAILVQAHPTGNLPLPVGLALSLLDDAGQTLQSVEADQEGYIQLRRFRAPEGTAFQVELELEGQQIVEAFQV